MRVYMAANRDKINERQRARRVANLEKERARGRASYRKNGLKRSRDWRAANREKVNEQQRARYAANAAYFSARSRAYYAENRKTILKQLRVIYAANPEKFRARTRAYHAANPGKWSERLSIARAVIKQLGLPPIPESIGAATVLKAINKMFKDVGLEIQI